MAIRPPSLAFALIIGHANEKKKENAPSETQGRWFEPGGRNANLTDDNSQSANFRLELGSILTCSKSLVKHYLNEQSTRKGRKQPNFRIQATRWHQQSNTTNMLVAWRGPDHQLDRQRESILCEGEMSDMVWEINLENVGICVVMMLPSLTLPHLLRLNITIVRGGENEAGRVVRCEDKYGLIAQALSTLEHREIDLNHVLTKTKIIRIWEIQH